MSTDLISRRDVSYFPTVKYLFRACPTTRRHRHQPPLHQLANGPVHEIKSSETPRHHRGYSNKMGGESGESDSGRHARADSDSHILIPLGTTVFEERDQGVDTGFG
jgi:hypothetical protein